MNRPLNKLAVINTRNNDPLNIIVIGLGHQSLDDHIPAIKDSSEFELVGVVDVNRELAASVGAQEGVPYDVSVEGILSALGSNHDCALVAIPHSSYLPIIRLLANRKIHILKEKPFAVSLEDAQTIKGLVEKMILHCK